jgi:hypothetical protein
MKKIIGNIIGIILAVAVGVGIAFAGGQGSVELWGLPLFMLLILAAYLIQWIVFIFAYLQKSERFFDLTGSLTYITLATAAVLLIPNIDRRAVLLLALVVIWATRLGTFLFGRVLKQGKDDRFDEIKVSFSSFLLTWTLQGLWVTFTAAAAFAAITATQQQPLGWLALIGLHWCGPSAISSSWSLTHKKVPSVATRRTKISSSAPVCGPGPVIPIISVRSCCGWVWPSSHSPY